MAEPITIELDLLKGRILEELRIIRQENRQIITALPNVLERIRSQDKRFDEIERRLSVLNDDLSTTVKIELGGGFANMETRLEQSFDTKLEALEATLLAAIDALRPAH